MRPDRNIIKKRARVIQGTVGVVCIAMLVFVTVWAVRNAVTGFDDSSAIKTADTSSAAESRTESTAGNVSGAEPSAESTQSDDTQSDTTQPAVTTAATTTAAEQTAPAVTTTKTNYTGWMTESIDETPAENVPQFPEAKDIADDFSDAVFIGNSLTVGLSMNCGKPLATFYASTGLNVNTVWDSATIALDGGGYGTVFDALAQKQFGRVYVMFGINEVGWPYWDVFRTNYAEVVNKIKELQPNAKIYI